MKKRASLKNIIGFMSLSVIGLLTAAAMFFLHVLYAGINLAVMAFAFGCGLLFFKVRKSMRTASEQVLEEKIALIDPKNYSETVNFNLQSRLRPHFAQKDAQKTRIQNRQLFALVSIVICLVVVSTVFLMFAVKEFYYKDMLLAGLYVASVSLIFLAGGQFYLIFAGRKEE